MRIIGVSGLPRSGKDTVAEMLMRRGWYGVSFGDIVRDYARKRHADKPDPISVKNMTNTSNWLRETRGSDVILKEALARYQAELANGASYEGLVLYSVRAPVEADFILAKGGDVVWVETSDEIRFERSKAARREGEAVIDFAEFRRQENLQWQPQPGIPGECK